jgi:hypothetical protein
MYQQQIETCIELANLTPQVVTALTGTCPSHRQLLLLNKCFSYPDDTPYNVYDCVPSRLSTWIAAAGELTEITALKPAEPNTTIAKLEVEDNCSQPQYQPLEFKAF